MNRLNEMFCILLGSIFVSISFAAPKMPLERIQQAEKNKQELERSKWGSLEEEQVSLIQNVWLGLDSKEGFERLGNLYDNQVDYIDPYLDNRTCLPKNEKNLVLLKNYWWGLYSFYISRGILAQFRFANVDDKNDRVYRVSIDKETGLPTYYIHWEMYAMNAVTKEDLAMLVTGLAEMRFNKAGKVIYHKDHMEIASFLEKEGKSLLEKQQQMSDMLLGTGAYTCK